VGTEDEVSDYHLGTEDEVPDYHLGTEDEVPDYHLGTEDEVPATPEIKFSARSRFLSRSLADSRSAPLHMAASHSRVVSFNLSASVTHCHGDRRTHTHTHTHTPQPRLFSCVCAADTEEVNA